MCPRPRECQPVPNLHKFENQRDRPKYLAIVSQQFACAEALSFLAEDFGAVQQGARLPQERLHVGCLKDVAPENHARSASQGRPAHYL
jgi:hypothetical protein